LAWINLEGNIMQYLGTVDPIAEGDMLESNCSAYRWQRHPRRIEGRFGARVEDVSEARHRQPSLMEILPDLRKPQHWCTDTTSKDVECHQLSDSKTAVNDKLGPDIQHGCHDYLADKLHALAGDIAELQHPEA
jgi:hypothetical protein